jgi:hypothetical protein
MTEPTFKIFYGEKLIGKSSLEKADVPMCVVYGQIELENIENGYAYFKTICIQSQVGFTDDKYDKFITTKHIPQLKVIDSDGTEIKGLATYVSEQGSSDFEITIEGIPAKMLELKFKSRIDQYKNLFKEYLVIDNIAEIGIDSRKRLFIKPEKAIFTLIYRTATEVHWDEKMKALFSPEPNEWTYLDWYKQIISVAEIECNHKLQLTSATNWSNISADLRKQILESS